MRTVLRCCILLLTAALSWLRPGHAQVDATNSSAAPPAAAHAAADSQPFDPAQAAFTQLWPEGTLEIQYMELSPATGPGTGLLTLLSREDGYIALLHYTSQPPAKVQLSQLPLPAHQ